MSEQDVASALLVLFTLFAVGVLVWFVVELVADIADMIGRKP